VELAGGGSGGIQPAGNQRQHRHQRLFADLRLAQRTQGRGRIRYPDVTNSIKPPLSPIAALAAITAPS